MTTILLFHPDLSRSRTNAPLAAVAAALPDVDVIDMTARFPAGVVADAEGAAEAARLLAAGRLVLQFPLQWYSTPALLKSWMDVVLTRMMYVHPETEGRAIAGKPLMVAITAGNTAEAYTPAGAARFTIDDLMAPLRATALRCGLIWTPPFVVFEAGRLSAEGVDAAARAYADRLSSWPNA